MLGGSNQPRLTLSENGNIMLVNDNGKGSCSIGGGEFLSLSADNISISGGKQEQQNSVMEVICSSKVESLLGGEQHQAVLFREGEMNVSNRNSSKLGYWNCK